MRHATWGSALLTVALLAPCSLAAQAAGKKPAQQGAGAPAKLVFRREVFSYPTLGRRNPFHPLVGEQGGPRFDQMRLQGIIYDDQDPRQSVACLGTSVVTESADSANVTVSPGQAWYLKVGQTIGNVRIVEIDRDRVVVDVEDFGQTTRKIMQVQTRGGTP